MKYLNADAESDAFQVKGYIKGASAIWDLHINSVTQKEQGTYQCQVNTTPKIFHPVALNVVSE